MLILYFSSEIGTTSKPNYWPQSVPCSEVPLLFAHIIYTATLPSLYTDKSQGHQAPTARRRDDDKLWNSLLSARRWTRKRTPCTSRRSRLCYFLQSYLHWNTLQPSRSVLQQRKTCGRERFLGFQLGRFLVLLTTFMAHLATAYKVCHCIAFVEPSV